MVHSPPYEDWDLTLTVGNTLAFEACIRSLLTRGDSIIMDEYAYTSGIYACRPQGLNIVGIAMDSEGMRPDILDERLSNWNGTQGPKPRVAYIVPYLLQWDMVNVRTGQNPTGSSMFLQRRKDLYAVFQKHDILIIEDEPYCKTNTFQLTVRFLTNGTLHWRRKSQIHYSER
jgi:aromatic amino acid aminotransferase I / 2-aminoadipate transaminase